MKNEEKTKIQAWLPLSIWIKIEELGFKSQSEAVTFAFKKLLEDPKKDNSGSDPNRSLLNELQELKARLDEREWRIEYMNAELEKSKIREAELKDMFNSHVSLVQALVNHKEMDPHVTSKWWKFK